MKKSVLPVLSKTLAGLLVAVGMVSAFAQAKKEVTFGHQDLQLPWRILMDLSLKKPRVTKLTTACLAAVVK